MSNFALLLVCLLAGVLLKRLPTFPADTHKGLNAFIIYIALPAVALKYIPTMQFSWAMLIPFLVGGVILLMALLFFKLLSFFWRIDRASLGCLVLTCGLGNTSFVGFPMVVALYGATGLSVAVLVDQGTFLALAIGGVSVAMVFSSGKIDSAVILKKLLYFPPFIAFVAALLLVPMGGLGKEVQEVLDKLASTLTPLALVSVGLQLKFEKNTFQWDLLAVGLFFKLVIAPFVFYVFYFLILNQKDLTAKVVIAEAAMAPMVTASILAVEYKLNPTLANLFVGIGIPFSLLTVLGWWWFLGY